MKQLLFRLENLTLIEEVGIDEQRICCFYCGDMTCKLGFSHELVL